MPTIEFETEAKNGSIQIPEEYRGRLTGKLQVIVCVAEKDLSNLSRDEIYDREKDRAENYIKFLMKNPLKVDRSIPFLTRDEIYDRKL